MKPVAALGWVLVVLGVVVLAMQGISYTKERESVRMGPVEVAAERRGFIPPVAGVVALVAGVALVLSARRRS